MSRHFAFPWKAFSRVVAGLITVVSAFAADTVFTSPRGIYTVKVPGATEATPQVRTYLGIQLLPDTRAVGLAGTVDGNTLSLGNLNDPRQIEDPERKCYVHALTGGGRGFVTDIDQFRTSDFVCAEELTPWIQPGTQLRIRPHPLLIDLLGATNRFGLGAGLDAESADNVVVWDPDAQQERVYYFHSIHGRWEEKGIDADAGHAIFRFPYGFYIVRRTPGTLRIVLSGEIGSDAILLPVRPAANVFSLPVNLSASLDKIFPTTGDFPIISGPNSTRADILVFEEPTTGAQRGPFYHLAGPDTAGWREIGVSGSEAPGRPLDFLSTLILRREGNASRVLAEGSLEPPAIPLPSLPADPEPGEFPLNGELPFPMRVLPAIVITVETSTDLETWNTFATPTIADGKAVFNLPQGQGRAFYRLKVTFPG